MDELNEEEDAPLTNPAEVSDRLCDSMVELFEYADNLTKSLEEDGEDIDNDTSSGTFTDVNQHEEQTVVSPEIHGVDAGHGNGSTTDDTVLYVTVDATGDSTFLNDILETQATNLENNKLDCIGKFIRPGCANTVCNSISSMQNMSLPNKSATTHSTTGILESSEEDDPSVYKVLDETGMPNMSDSISPVTNYSTPKMDYSNKSASRPSTTSIPDSPEIEDSSSIFVYKAMDNVTKKTQGNKMSLKPLIGAPPAKDFLCKPIVEDHLDKKAPIKSHVEVWSDNKMSNKCRIGIALESKILATPLDESQSDNKMPDVPQDAAQSDYKMPDTLTNKALLIDMSSKPSTIEDFDIEIRGVKGFNGQSDDSSNSFDIGSSSQVYVYEICDETGDHGVSDNTSDGSQSSLQSGSNGINRTSYETVDDICYKEDGSDDSESLNDENKTVVLQEPVSVDAKERISFTCKKDQVFNSLETHINSDQSVVDTYNPFVLNDTEADNVVNDTEADNTEVQRNDNITKINSSKMSLKYISDNLYAANECFEMDESTPKKKNDVETHINSDQSVVETYNPFVLNDTEADNVVNDTEADNTEVQRNDNITEINSSKRSLKCISDNLYAANECFEMDESTPKKKNDVETHINSDQSGVDTYNPFVVNDTEADNTEMQRNDNITTINSRKRSLKCISDNSYAVNECFKMDDFTLKKENSVETHINPDQSGVDTYNPFVLNDTEADNVLNDTEADDTVVQINDNTTEINSSKRSLKCISANSYSVNDCFEMNDSTLKKKNNITQVKNNSPVFPHSDEDQKARLNVLEESNHKAYLKDHNTQLVALKKRHLSSKGDIETTPKRHKAEGGLSTEDALSPIENALRLTKERGLVEVLDETPVVYCRHDGRKYDCSTPVSSTPLVQDNRNEKHLNIRKVIWKVDYREDMDYSAIDELAPVCGNTDDAKSIPLNEISQTQIQIHNDVRKVVCKNLHSKPGMNNEDEINANIHGCQVLKDCGQLNDTITNSSPDIHSNPTTPNRNHWTSTSRLSECNNTQLSITDSSYFAENTSRLTGRFKNVEATISKIDLDEDDVLLYEDILGLESGYDDSDIDEETLLADDPDETESIRQPDDLPFKNNVNPIPESPVKTWLVSNEKDVSDNKKSESIDNKHEKPETTDFDVNDQVNPQLLMKENDRKTESDMKVVNSSIHSVEDEMSQSFPEIIPNTGESVEPQVRVKVGIVDEIEIDKQLIDTSQMKHITETKGSAQEENYKSDIVQAHQIKIHVHVEAEDKEVKLKNEVKATNVDSPKHLQSHKDTIPKDTNNNKYDSSEFDGTDNDTKDMDISSLDEDESNNMVIQNMDISFLERDKSNKVMEDVMRKWQCDGIPSQDVNLTVAATYHKNYHKRNNSQKHVPASLEGEKISCLNFYEDEMNTKHQAMNHCSLSQATYKLTKQKQDLDSMKLMALESFEQECYQRCMLLRNRHRKEYEQLQRRQAMQYRNMSSRNIPRFVKQQQLMELGLTHGVERQRLSEHQRFEFESLSTELQFMFQTETERHQTQVAPVEMLISQVEQMKREATTGSTEKYGPTVMVSLCKRPCKENNWKTSTVQICLPVTIAQALSHEEDIFNHYYKF